MRASLALAAILLAIPAGLASGQEPVPSRPPASRRPGELDRAEVRRLAERWRALPPEERARLKRRYQELRQQRSPEQIQLLRAHLARRSQEERRALEDRRRAFEQRPEPERERYRKLVRRLLRDLPEDERRALAQLDPAARRERLQGLIGAHRQAQVDRHLQALPPEVRQRLAAELSGVEGRERFRRAREGLERFVIERVRAVLRDPSRTNAEKRQVLEDMLERHVPWPERREAIRRRILQEQERRTPRPPRPPRPPKPGPGEGGGRS